MWRQVFKTRYLFIQIAHANESSYYSRKPLHWGSVAYHFDLISRFYTCKTREYLSREFLEKSEQHQHQSFVSFCRNIYIFYLWYKCSFHINAQISGSNRTLMLITRINLERTNRNSPCFVKFETNTVPLSWNFGQS